MCDKLPLNLKKFIIIGALYLTPPRDPSIQSNRIHLYSTKMLHPSKTELFPKFPVKLRRDLHLDGTLAN